MVRGFLRDSKKLGKGLVTLKENKKNEANIKKQEYFTLK